VVQIHSRSHILATKLWLLVFLSKPVISESKALQLIKTRNDFKSKLINLRDYY
jgi:hypothetical protein